MAVLPATAAAAYQAVSNMGISSAGSASSAGTASAGDAGGGFSDFLTNALQDSVQTMKHGEQMAAAGTAGKANLLDVVSAVNAAEVTLDTVVAVRDKVISAYQSIMDMSI